MDIKKALLIKSAGELTIISLPQPQQLTEATDIQEEKIRMSMNLPYVEGTSEKLQRILRFHKVRSTFFFEKTLRKLLCKLID